MQHTEGKFTDASGYDIYHQTWRPDGGVRACILLVHGMAEHSARYAELAQAFTDRDYSVWAVDLPGHGKSSGDRVYVANFSHYLDSVATVLALMQEQCVDKPLFLLGHSMGGLISANFLLRNQSAFRGVVLSGAALTTALQPPTIQMFIIKLLSAVLPKFRVMQLDANGVSRDPAVVADYIADPLNYGGKICARTVAQLFRVMAETVDGFARIELPLLILHGAEDSMTSPGGSELMQQQAGSSDKTLHIYPQLYHEIFNEPERHAIFDEVLAWLDRRSN